MKSLTWRLLWALIALAVVAAGCGGDDPDDESSAPGSTEAAEADEPAEEDAEAETDAEDAEDASEEGGDPSGVETASARVDAFRQAQGSLPITEPLAELPTGKKVAYIQCGVPVCAEINTGIEGAAAELGMELDVFTHDDTPENVAAAWQAAVDTSPDVVLASGNPREWFADQLTALEAAGVPVIVWSVPEGYEPGDGITANLLSVDDYYFYGVLMADYAVAQTGGEGTIVFFGLPAFPVLATAEQGFTEEMARVCPDCTVENVSIDLTALLAGEVPSQVVSTLQATPGASHLVFAFGGMMFGVPESMADAGIDVPAISQAGGPLNFGFIANGTVQTAEVGLASEFLGWRAMDAAARVLAGQPVGRADTPDVAVIDGHPDILNAGLPLQILEADDMGFMTDDPAALWPGVEGFKDQYADLWGTN